MKEQKDAPKIERGNTQIAFKAGFWYVVSTFLVKGLSFITTPIFARIMSEAEYGEFSNYANWQSILFIIIGLEMHNTLSRAYYDYTEEYDKYISTITFSSCAITVIFYVLFLFCGSWIYEIISIPPEYVNILFITIMFQSCKYIYLARERTLYRYKSVALLSVISLAVPTIISVFLVMYVQQDKLSARIYGFYVPFALIGMFCAIVLLRNNRTFKWEYFKYAILLAIPLFMHYFTAYMLTSTNIVITKSMVGAQAAAIVSIAGSVMQILTMLFQSVTGALTTWIMDNLQKKEEKKIRKCSIIFSFSIGIVVIGVILFAPELVWIIGGPKYEQSVYLIPAWAFSIFIQTVTTVFTIILTYDKNIGRPAVVTGLVAILSIAAKIMLLPQFGYQVFPLVNVVAFFIIFIVNYIFVVNTGYSKYVNIKGIAVVMVAMAIFTAIGYILYDYTLLRYSVIAILGIASIIFLYKSRDLWMQIIKKKKNI